MARSSNTPLPPQAPCDRGAGGRLHDDERAHHAEQHPVEHRGDVEVAGGAAPRLHAMMATSIANTIRRGPADDGPCARHVGSDPNTQASVSE
jgi:hypothetical protein